MIVRLCISMKNQMCQIVEKKQMCQIVEQKQMCQIVEKNQMCQIVEKKTDVSNSRKNPRCVK
jgi:hypothetical protein